MNKRLSAILAITLFVAAGETLTPPSETPALAREVTPAKKLVCPAPSAYVTEVSPNVWEVMPTAFLPGDSLYGQCDGYNIQYAFDNCVPGCTVQLDAVTSETYPRSNSIWKHFKFLESSLKY